jgi:hypothetical protein
LLRSFTCRRCGQLVFCENVACLRCGAPLGVVPEARELATVADAAADGLAASLAAEDAERWAVFPLDQPGLPLTTRAGNPERGLAVAGL